MSSFRAINTSRITYHEQERQSIDDRRAALRPALADAQAALARALHTFDTLTQDLHELIERHAEVSVKITELRQNLDPQVMATFPCELLHAIFSSLASDVDAWTSSDDVDFLAHYNKERATFPFRLAAVSKRWRRAVTDLPSLWAGYLALGPVTTAEQCSTVRRYLDVVVQRSQTRPLNILLDWRDTPWSSYLVPILLSVGAQAYRWRKATFVLPDDASTSCLRYSTPLLEELAVYQKNAIVRTGRISPAFHPKASLGDC
ncbi:hypothetical protein EXIGLDRAFT_736025 [Exidia glandulosa HHB12029]|uniref:F-box domain-containing protein n=1 Tax=Exidia glandulosa HHB12029 TaxID=1314781 RepID=A0A166NC91_EXIGL|nr:hypothetical protein EXIGLDRAFT_736025 [Exidia glandulosa HHB12029]